VLPVALGLRSSDPAAQNATTFDSPATYVLPVAGRSDRYIFMADRWKPENAIDGRYVWLPVRWRNGLPVLAWTASWVPTATQD
jgi:hypothetical protein